MKRNIALFVLVLIMALPAFSQDKKAADEKAADKGKKEATEKKASEDKKDSTDQVYKEIPLEDFESSSYGDANLRYRISGDQKAGAAIRDVFPSPSPKSSKYLGVKLYGRQGDYLTVTPPKKIIIKQYCRAISLWVYGKNFSGELSLMLIDAEGRPHRLIVGKLNFIGWRKMTVQLNDDIAQEDKYLSQKREIELKSLLYNPGNTGRLPQWNFFYVDDITAQVREKYTDKQSDEW